MRITWVEHGNKEYVRGKVHTQTIEGMWSILKRGIYGVYRVVSKKYLQAYIDEYSWRYKQSLISDEINNRKHGDQMFNRLLNEVGPVKLISPN